MWVGAYSSTRVLRGMCTQRVAIQRTIGLSRRLTHEAIITPRCECHLEQALVAARAQALSVESSKNTDHTLVLNTIFHKVYADVLFFLNSICYMFVRPEIARNFDPTIVLRQNASLWHPFERALRPGWTTWRLTSTTANRPLHSRGIPSTKLRRPGSCSPRYCLQRNAFTRCTPASSLCEVTTWHSYGMTRTKTGMRPLMRKWREGRLL